MFRIFKSISEKELASSLCNGSVGVLPTDTLYGLVCSANNSDAIKRLYEIKSRDKKPGTIVASNVDQLVSLGFKKRYLKAVEKYWPGAVSIIIPCVDLDYLNQGVGSVAVRVSDDLELNLLLDISGPLLTSSANMPGLAPSNTMIEAQQYFGDTVDFYVDGGDLSSRQPSTIIRVVDDTVEVIRSGAVTIDEETGEIL